MSPRTPLLRTTTQSAPSSLRPRPRTKARTSACRWRSKARASEESCRHHHHHHRHAVAPLSPPQTSRSRCRPTAAARLLPPPPPPCRAGAAALPPPLPSCRHCHRLLHHPARFHHFRHRRRAAAAILAPPPPSCHRHRATAKLPHPSCRRHRCRLAAVALPPSPLVALLAPLRKNSLIHLLHERPRSGPRFDAISALVMPTPVSVMVSVFDASSVSMRISRGASPPPVVVPTAATAAAVPAAADDANAAPGGLEVTELLEGVARVRIGTPGKRRSPPPRSIFRAAPLGSRRGNRTSHLGGDAARRAAAAPARARGQALHKPVPSHRRGQQHSCYDVYGREVVRVLMFFSLSLKEDLRTLPPVEIGTFSTYLHAHMPKINSSPVKILKRSWKVPGKFSKLGLKKILNC